MEQIVHSVSRTVHNKLSTRQTSKNQKSIRGMSVVSGRKPQPRTCLALTHELMNHEGIVLRSFSALRIPLFDEYVSNTLLITNTLL